MSIVRDFFIHNPDNYTNQENLQWCWLRAVEWGQWPLFVSQLVAPILFLFFQWWKVAIGIVVLTWLWALVRYTFVSIFLSGFGPFIIIIKWPVSVGFGVYFWTQGNNQLAIISVLWSIITLLLVLICPNTQIGKIQTMLMNAMGYEKLDST